MALSVGAGLVVDGVRGIFGGYEMERRRMDATVRANCPHHQYENMDKFVLDIRRLVKKYIEAEFVDEIDRIRKVIVDKLGVGFCHHCAIYTAANMFDIIAMHRTDVAKVNDMNLHYLTLEEVSGLCEITFPNPAHSQLNFMCDLCVE